MIETYTRVYFTRHQVFTAIPYCSQTVIKFGGVANRSNNTDGFKFDGIFALYSQDHRGYMWIFNSSD